MNCFRFFPISIKNAFFKKEKKENKQTKITIKEKQNYLNELFSDDFLKENQKDIDGELESLNIRHTKL